MPDDGGGLGREFESPAARIGLEHGQAIRTNHLELVAITLAKVGQEDLPVTGRANGAHRIHATVPPVEVADHADALRVRCPHGEVHAAANAMGDGARAKAIVDPVVRALAQQVQIELRQHGSVAIGIIRLAGRTIRPGQAEAVVELVAPFVGHDAFEQAFGMNAGKDQAVGLAERDDLDVADMRPEDTDGDAAIDVMRTEHRERISVHAARDGVDCCARQRRGHIRMLLCGPYKLWGQAFRCVRGPYEPPPVRATEWP